MPLWWGVLMVGEAVHVWGQDRRVVEKSLYFMPNLAVNLRLLQKMSRERKKAETREQETGCHLHLSCQNRSLCRWSTETWGDYERCGQWRQPGSDQARPQGQLRTVDIVSGSHGRLKQRSDRQI